MNIFVKHLNKYSDNNKYYEYQNLFFLFFFVLLIFLIDNINCEYFFSLIANIYSKFIFMSTTKYMNALKPIIVSAKYGSFSLIPSNNHHVLSPILRFFTHYSMEGGENVAQMTLNTIFPDK